MGGEGTDREGEAHARTRVTQLKSSYSGPRATRPEKIWAR
jgi:hypothetical protein